ncbi:MAG: GC-type dockerin domain-anchored protein [Planctomycetota bacterium]
MHAKTPIRAALLAAGLSTTATLVEAQALLDQPVVPSEPAVESAQLTGTFVPSTNQVVLDDVILDRGGMLEAIRFTGDGVSNVYAFRIGVFELLPDDTRGGSVADFWPSIAATQPEPIVGGLTRYTATLLDPVRLEADTRYGVEIRACLIAPDRLGAPRWRWAAGQGDGTVLVDALDGSALGRVGVPGMAFTLLGMPDASDCPADVNRDGELNASDFFAWVTAYTNNDPAGDVNLDGKVNSSDFFAWLTAFTEGC